MAGPTEIEMAKIAEQAERYEDMVKYMKTFVENTKEPLSADSRNLLSVAYKNVVGAKRSSWRVIHSIESKADSKITDLAKTYKADIEEELGVCLQ